MIGRNFGFIAKVNWWGTGIILLLGSIVACESALGTSAGTFAFKGTSVREYVDKYVRKDGTDQLIIGDTNLFEMAVNGCSWTMTLIVPQQQPNKPSHVADDGTNYYVLAVGSAGTSRQGKAVVPYSHSARIRKSGSAFPRHHGLAPWLLFAGNCLTPAPAGHIAPLFDPGPQTELEYERTDDLTRNAFGPTLIRFFTKLGGTKNQRLLIAELEVVESRVENGKSVPTRAEFRKVHQRPDQSEVSLMEIYRLSDISWGRIDTPVAFRPEIKGATLITDHSLDPSSAYIADGWKTSIQPR